MVFSPALGMLATAIAASRLLAPYFGSSTIVWANIIGLILIYLSLGYWLGGKIADRRPDPRLLGKLILAAAAFIAVLRFVARPILDLTVRGLDAVSLGAIVGSFFAALALFAVPITLLGCVSPFAIRLSIADVRTAGTVSGRLYAISTVGSILGTFLSAIVLIPLIGTQRTMLACAVSAHRRARRCCSDGAGRWRRSRWPAPVAIPAGAIKSDGRARVRDGVDLPVHPGAAAAETARGCSTLNEGVANHSVWHPDSVLTGGEWDMFLVVPPLLDRPVKRILVIGNAGGTTARAFGALYPGGARSMESRSTPRSPTSADGISVSTTTPSSTSSTGAGRPSTCSSH